MRIPTESNITEIDEKIGTSTKQNNNYSTQFNNKEDITCDNCEKSEPEYYPKRDEISCKNCGMVLRQGLKDYTPLSNANFQMTSLEHSNTKKIEYQRIFNQVEQELYSTS